MCKTNLKSLSSFTERLEELKLFVQELLTRYDKEDLSKIKLVFWAKDGEYTPCLVEGAYNNWAGDEDILLSDIGEGVYPHSFIERLNHYAEQEPYNVAEHLAVTIVEKLQRDFNLPFTWLELKNLLWDEGSLFLDYDALYDKINFYLGNKDRASFKALIKEQYETDSSYSILEYGWEYYVAKELYDVEIPDRMDPDPMFGEVIGIDWSEDIRDWDCEFDKEDIRKERLERFILNIKNLKEIPYTPYTFPMNV